MAEMGIKQIRTTHAGALPRSAGLTKMIRDRAAGGAVDEAFLEHMLSTGVAEAVRLQRDCGLDSINDGELSKSNFMHYITERVSGIEVRQYAYGDGPTPLSITARDKKKFPDYFVGGTRRLCERRQGGNAPHRSPACLCRTPSICWPLRGGGRHPTV